MQSGIRVKHVFVVQLIYFTSLKPGSEFRLYAPSDSWISHGARSPGALANSLPRNGVIDLIKDIRQWKPIVAPKAISLDPESFAIARAVFWDTAGTLGRLEGQSDGIPYDDEDQPSRPFWIMDLNENRVISVAESLDKAKLAFEGLLERLSSSLDRAT